MIQHQLRGLLQEGQIPGKAEYDLLNAVDKQTNWLTNTKDKGIKANSIEVTLNRQKHLLPYDDTRVKLVNKLSPHGNYINATWVSKAGTCKVLIYISKVLDTSLVISHYMFLFSII